MKQRVADYIADFLVEHDIDTVFTVVGGGAMHLNDAFGRHEKLQVINNHHEQACTMAAEGYARQCGKMAAVCVTTGPGGTNAMTGVLGAYQDNVPMIIISGQVRYSITVESTGLNIRQFAPQEYSIVDSVKPMTKYAKMIRETKSIRYELEKSYDIATSGHKGPVWLDIPLNIQGDIIETSELLPYKKVEKKINCTIIAENVVEKIQNAERPLILVGADIRRANVHDEFVELVSKLRIPVVAASCVSDVLPINHRYYYGNFGIVGGRTGNFLVQNSDVILAIGIGMSLSDTSFNYQSFAPNAYKIMISSDEDVLRKPNIKVDYPVVADTGAIVKSLLHTNPSIQVNDDWIEYADDLKHKFSLLGSVCDNGNVNVILLTKYLMDLLPNNGTVLTGNSAGAASALYYGVVKDSQRLYSNIGCGSMGWDLPASIGAAVANNKDIDIVCITGDGSIQMNLQELQTIVRYNLPIKIIICSNGGYMGIVRTQINFFDGCLTGCTHESGLDIPDMQRIAYAYNIPYMKIEKNSDIQEKLTELLNIDGYAICEIIEDTTQTPVFKLSSIKLDNGEMVSAPFDDLSPLLERDVYNLYSRYRNWKNKKV